MWAMFCEIYNGGLMLKKSIYFISIIAVFMLFSSYARAEVDGEVQYILNTFPVSYTHLTLPTTPYV